MNHFDKQLIKAVVYCFTRFTFGQRGVKADETVDKRKFQGVI